MAQKRIVGFQPKFFITKTTQPKQEVMMTQANTTASASLLNIQNFLFN